MVRKSKNGSKANSPASKSSKAAVAPAPVKPNNTNGATLSNADALRVLYAALLRSRLVAEHAKEFSSAFEMKPEFDFDIGDEAITVGATTGLQPEDTIAASASHLGALIARGVPLKALLAQQAATESYLDGTSITARSLPDDPFNLGTGLALAQKLQKRQHVVVAFCRQENPPLETWHEALKSAAPLRLPILYVIKNGVAGKPASPDAANLEDFSFMTREYGFPCILVDGRDAVAVWRVAQESMHRARNGSGPTLIDCRMESQQDPLSHMEHYMRKRDAWDDRWKADLASRISAEIEEAVMTAVS